MSGKLQGSLGISIIWICNYIMEVKVIEEENEVYQKEKLLGEGAFGKAYLVKKRQTGQMLVIKEVSIDHMSPKERQETIKQAQILRNCNHPLIVKFVEVYATKQNKLKIVMEYAECGDLSKSIQTMKKSGRKFEENQILDWFTQICLAMKHVHDRKILHRDIKGQNIFITKANTLKLGDFGIARVLNKTQDKARTVVGTPYYLSPQIIENKPYSFKSDIWSMGVLLYEMCALAPPFNATSLQFLALKIVKGSYTSLPASYSPQLRGLVTQILQVDPNKRPSVSAILQKPFLQDRIRKFLSETYRADEFSHTVLHNQNIHIKNKLVKVQSSSRQKERDQKSIERKRQELKEEAAALKAQRDRQRQEERKREEQRLRQRREEEAEKIRRAQARLAEERRVEMNRRKQAEQKRAVEERKAWVEREKRKQEQMNRQHQQDQRRRVQQIADMARKRQKDEQEYYSRQEQLMAEQSRLQQQKQEVSGRRKSQKAKEEDKKRQDYAQLARQQWYQNQMIRKRAQERARQSESSYASEPSYQQEQPPVRKLSRDKPSSRIHEKRPSLPPPSQEQLQNAMMNPNFNPKGRAPVPSSKSKPASSKAIVPDRQPKVEKKDYSSGIREQMRKDREEFLKHKQGSPKEQPVEAVETLKPTKWGRQPSSRDKSTGDPRSRRNSEEQVGQASPQKQPTQRTGADEDSDGQVDLNVKDKQQFNDYLAELQGLLGNVQKNIDKIEGNQSETEVLPQMPVVEEQIMLREDDQQELNYSMTGSFQPVGQPQVSPQNADFDYFSDYSKLEELRMNLEEKFGTDTFINIYRALENELQSKGLAQFDIIQVVTSLEDVDVKLVTDNLPLLLTVIVMEEKMMG